MMALNLPPSTPQRPTPGAFVNTPAPNRPALFRGASTQQQQLQPAAPVTTAPALAPLERAARAINTALDKDASYRPLEDTLGQGVSGEYDISTDTAWEPFQKMKTYNFPERAFDQLNQGQMSSSMGLFADINHAWCAVDNQLYLWDYTNPNPELVGYEEQPNNIVSVKLVKPRQKVFVPTVSHLLVVATTVDISLIAVECERGPEGVHNVILYRTGLSVSVKGITVSSIAGTSTGRIFFSDGSQTEDVYELNYQQEDRWFSAKCSKKNHVNNAIITLPSLPFYNVQKPAFVVQMEVDETRRVLYTLSSNGTIRVFYMRTAHSLDLVLIQGLTTTRSMCAHFASGLSKLDIIGIDTITAPEANQMSLVATTSNGARIFFSVTSGSYYTDTIAAPTNIQVRHIRAPPPDASTSSPPRAPSNQLQPYQAASPIALDSRRLTITTKTRRYAPGSSFFFVNDAREPTQQHVFLTAPNTGLYGSSQGPVQGVRFTESGQDLFFEGTIEEVGLVTEPFSASNRPRGFGNELAVQFDKPLCEFAIMTSYGIHTVRRRRLIDIFAGLITYGGGPEGIQGDLKKIVTKYGRPEMAATALAVACGQASTIGPDSRVAQISDPEVIELARKAFIEMGGKAQLSENATVDNLNADSVIPSSRHEGIATYVSRLVRSIWKTPVIRESLTPTGLILAPTHTIAKLQGIQRALSQLQDFLDSNKAHIDGLGGPEALGRAASRQEEVELQGENRALTSLLQLIKNIIEGVAFVLVLFEEKLEDILVLLPPESQARARQLTLEGLFSVKEGKDLAKELVKAIVQRNIMKGSNVETVAEALRRKCGSFCSSDDVIIFKAQENLKKASDLGANAERGRIQLNDSLRLFEQVAKSLSEEHLTQAVDKYIQLEFYAGAIRIALIVAKELDRANKALSWIKDGRPAQDAREVFYAKRTSCYELVFRVIEAVDRANSSQGVVPDGVISQVTRRRDEAYQQINDSEDEVFQNYLYDWYLSKGWQDRLLQIQSPYVVDYLRRSAATDIAHADLLWRYYAHYHDYLNAASVQFDLAKSDFDLTLEKRIEYLSRARANASTRATAFIDGGSRGRQSRQELLRNISDYLDIANIQDDVLQKIKNDVRIQGPRKAEVVGKLNGQIQALDELYHSYADQAGYYDISLLIYNCADYRNLPDIRSTWTNLVEQTHRKATDEDHAAPWELVAYEVESIGRRVSLNENVFPVQILLQLLLQYDVEYYTHSPQTAAQNADLRLCGNFSWPVDTFIKVSAPFELLVATLESLWYAQEHPFNTGGKRRLLAKWIIYTAEQWYESSNRAGGALFGSEENAIGLADCLRVVLGAGEMERGSQEEREWVERGRSVREVVEGAAR